MIAEREPETLNGPVMVPRMIVPFLSSIVTVSFVNFIKNLQKRTIRERRNDVLQKIRRVEVKKLIVASKVRIFQ